jgi:hypothetical protein
MNLKDRIKLTLDTTILQTNTAIDLVSYIKRQRNIINEMRYKYESDNNKKAKIVTTTEYQIISEAFERIITEHTEALHRRVGRAKFEKNFVDEDEPDEFLEINKIINQGYNNG